MQLLFCLITDLLLQFIDTLNSNENYYSVLENIVFRQLVKIIEINLKNYIRNEKRKTY